MQRSFLLAVRNTLLTGMLLAACYEEGPQLCPVGAHEPTSDTLIGARVGGRAVLVPKGTGVSAAEFSHDIAAETLYLLGTRREDSPPQSFEIYVSDFHGVGSYPVGAFGASNQVFIIYSCGYSPTAGEPQDARDRLEYWSLDGGYPGDSVWVTQWDSLSGKVRGRFSYHSAGSAGDTVEVTDGAFDFTASLH